MTHEFQEYVDSSHYLALCAANFAIHVKDVALRDPELKESLRFMTAALGDYHEKFDNAGLQCELLGKEE